MAKRKWNGSFDESQYTETDNMVLDVIANGGRLLHEPTSDGYTHEITDRGDYISDDYYFPQKTAGKKPHVHYELRSTGDVLIDGKKIVADTTGGTTKMKLKHGHELSRGPHMDRSIIKKETDDQVQEGHDLQELGSKFESDKAKLEAEIDKVQNSKISEEDKRALIAELNSAIEALQEQYERDVAEEQERIQQELRGQIETMQEAADELERQAEELRNLRMQVASTDASAAADEADRKKQAFEQMKAEYVEKLNLQIEQAAMQQRNIRNRRLGGS